MKFKVVLLKDQGQDNLGFEVGNVLSTYSLDEDEAKLVIDGEGDSLIDWLVDQLEQAGVLSDDDVESEDDDEEEIE